MLILQAAHNSIATPLRKVLTSSSLWTAVWSSLAVDTIPEQTRFEHEGIFNALMDRDEALVETLLRAHIMRNWRNRTKRFTVSALMEQEVPNESTI